MGIKEIIQNRLGSYEFFRKGIKVTIWQILKICAVLIFLFLALYNLTNYPATWYDEGSHLHVPKTFVRYGVYADLSSEGFRYYGPTVGVGPTVLFVIAIVFKVFGIGLVQARLVMVLYLLGTILIFFNLAKLLGGEKFAWVASALLITSQVVSLLEYGREVLGEVPGLFFILCGLWIWFIGWGKGSVSRQLIVGLFFGLGCVTKYEYFLILMGALGIFWFLNLVYYKLLSQREIIIPAVAAGMCFGLWQLISILYLGPANAAQNFAILRQTAAEAAFAFSPALIKRAIQQLLSYNVYFDAFIPALLYVGILVLKRDLNSQRWVAIYTLVAFNLIWFAFASIGWLRYAFLGLTFATLIVAKFFTDLTRNYSLDIIDFLKKLKNKQYSLGLDMMQWVMMIWLGIIILIPFAQTLRNVIFTAPGGEFAMAEYITANIPQQTIIETWEQEMGFLTDNNYHYPPQVLLNDATAFIWKGGTPPGKSYHYVETNLPPYVLVGDFAKYVQLYSMKTLESKYRLIKTIGAYDLYQLKN